MSRFVCFLTISKAILWDKINLRTLFPRSRDWYKLRLCISHKNLTQIYLYTRETSWIHISKISRSFRQGQILLILSLGFVLLHLSSLLFSAIAWLTGKTFLRRSKNASHLLGAGFCSSYLQLLSRRRHLFLNSTIDSSEIDYLWPDLGNISILELRQDYLWALIRKKRELLLCLHVRIIP